MFGYDSDARRELLSRERLSVLIGVGLGAFFTAPAVLSAGARGLVVSALGALAAWALHRAGAELLGAARCWGLVAAAGFVVNQLLVAGTPPTAELAGLLAGAGLLGVGVALVVEQIEAWSEA